MLGNPATHSPQRKRLLRPRSRLQAFYLRFCSLPGLDLRARRHDQQNGATLTDSPDPVHRARRLRARIALLAVLGAVLFLSSCAAGPNAAAGTGEDPAGFWLGLWHGIIFPVTLVISLFTDNVSVYEVANAGNWYDFGFFLGVAMSLGGSAGGAGVRAKRRS